jgi:hypothetical protein
MNSSKQQPIEKNRDAPRAQHGARSEVTWEGGSGRQPYANQGRWESGQHHQGGEFSGGGRGDLSGRNLEQLEQVRGGAQAPSTGLRTGAASEHAEQHQRDNDDQRNAKKPKNDRHVNTPSWLITGR